MHTRAWRRTRLTSLIIGTAVLAAACSAGSAPSAPTATDEPAAVSASPSSSAAVPSAEPVGGSITGPGQSSAFRWTRSGGIASLGAGMRFANATNAFKLDAHGFVGQFGEFTNGAICG